METLIKTCVKVCLIISIILSANLIYYIYKPEKVFEVKQSVGKLPDKMKVIEMDRLPENYNCKVYTDIEQGKLTFCERRKAVEMKVGNAYVRGYYILDTNTIWVDKDLPVDYVLHELVHMLDGKYRAKDLETRAYLFQDMVNQLNIIK